MDLVDSNHGSLVFRRAFKHGIPRAYIKEYNEFLDVGKGLKWHDDLTIDTPLLASLFLSWQDTGYSQIGYQHGNVMCVRSLSLAYGCPVVRQ